ncbi:permease [Streptococcus pneumoniae]|nr:permease [Streptococcus pneumoniae]CWI04298.1 permease [Streptococcus pneumoniae]
MKKSILTTLLFAVLYFLCMGIGVLLGNLFDQTGNMFYAPAFTALVGGSVYMILVAKVPRFGAITTIGLVIALFFLGTKHGAGSFLPGIICGLLADEVAHLGKYKDKTKNFLSLFSPLVQQDQSCLCGLRPKPIWLLFWQEENPKNISTVSWSLQTLELSFYLSQVLSSEP